VTPWHQRDDLLHMEGEARRRAAAISRCARRDLSEGIVPRGMEGGGDAAQRARGRQPPPDEALGRGAPGLRGAEAPPAGPVSTAAPSPSRAVGQRGVPPRRLRDASAFAPRLGNARRISGGPGTLRTRETTRQTRPSGRLRVGPPRSLEPSRSDPLLDGLVRAKMTTGSPYDGTEVGEQVSGRQFFRATLDSTLPVRTAFGGRGRHHLGLDQRDDVPHFARLPSARSCSGERRSLT